MTSKIVYNGNLRTEAIHINSGQLIITDAPKDNHGKGEAFSPTDLVATSIASCMITVMGIKGSAQGINVDGAEADIIKTMASNPRRISKVDIKLTMPQRNYTDKEKKILRKIADNCPVMKSIHPEIEVNLDMVWQ